MIKDKIKKGDVIIIALVLAAAAILAAGQAVWYFHSDSALDGAAKRALVRYGGREAFYRLDRDYGLTVTNNGYTLELAIENGTIRVINADCPDQLCVQMGALSGEIGYVACVPANVLIRVVSEDGEQNADWISG